MLRAPALSFLCAAVVALTAAGCGQSGSSGEGDPAALVPAGTAFYVEAAVQPTGDRREGALAAAAKILHTDDPAGQLRDLVDEQLAEEGLDWQRDFASWLGEDAGFWASNLQAEDPSWGFAFASKDADAAKAALARFAKSDDAPHTARSYKGVAYEVDDEGVAAGIVGDYLVLAREDAFKRAVDARDGTSLADEDRYRDAIGDLDENRLGHFYFDIAPLVDAAARQDPTGAREYEQFKAFFPIQKLGPVRGAFTADGDGMALDSVVTGVPDGPFRRLMQLG